LVPAWTQMLGDQNFQPPASLGHGSAASPDATGWTGSETAVASATGPIASARTAASETRSCFSLLMVNLL